MLIDFGSSISKVSLTRDPCIYTCRVHKLHRAQDDGGRNPLPRRAFVQALRLGRKLFHTTGGCMGFLTAGAS